MRKRTMKTHLNLKTHTELTHSVYKGLKKLEQYINGVMLLEEDRTLEGDKI
jgi:hypothetical protein